MPWHQAPLAAGFLVFALAGVGLPFALLSLLRQTDVPIGVVTLLCATTIAAVLVAGRDDNESIVAVLLFAASAGAPLAAIVYVPASLLRQWLLGAVRTIRASPVPDARARDLDVVLSRARMSAAPLLLAPSLRRTPDILAAWVACALLVPAVWTVAARRWRWAFRRYGDRAERARERARAWWRFRADPELRQTLLGEAQALRKAAELLETALHTYASP